MDSSNESDEFGCTGRKVPRNNDIRRVISSSFFEADAIVRAHSVLLFILLASSMVRSPIILTKTAMGWNEARDVVILCGSLRCSVH